MSVEGDLNIFSVKAAQDFGAGEMFKGVSISGTIASDARLAVGVSRGKVVTGGQLPVVCLGMTKVSVGDAVNTAGFPLALTTSGYFIPTRGLVVLATSGTVSGTSSAFPACARALATAASGDLCPAFVNFVSPPLISIS